MLKISDFSVGLAKWVESRRWSPPAIQHHILPAIIWVQQEVVNYPDSDILQLENMKPKQMTMDTSPQMFMIDS